MYRVMACDLDGTLLKDDKTISKENIEALKLMTDKGVIFLPSTGRTHRELPAPLRDLPFLHYALCCNGGAVYDYKEDKYIYEDAIPYDLALEILEYVKAMPVYETVVTNGRRIARGEENGEICDYVKKVAVKDILFNFTGAPDVKKAFAEKHQGAQKLLLYLKEGADKESVQSDLRQRFPQLSVSSSGPKFIEVNTKGVDKGKALTRFCQLMEIPIEESIAFGDAENDLSMLKASGKAVVMANGTPEAKACADLICPSNNDDGVAKAIKQIWGV
ncbi:MAG: HAD family phosphatase [Erysipelotrichaceae bacterium]|nr:HAD family phosphatase [Erysipelotrichaceae bacterium]